MRKAPALPALHHLLKQALLYDATDLRPDFSHPQRRDTTRKIFCQLQLR
jgi:hypothetical protein